METRQRKQAEVCLQLLHSGLWVRQELEGGQLFLDTQQNLCERRGNANKQHNGFEIDKGARENPERGFLEFVSFMHHWNQKI